MTRCFASATSSRSSCTRSVDFCRDSCRSLISFDTSPFGLHPAALSAKTAANEVTIHARFMRLSLPWRSASARPTAAVLCLALAVPSRALGQDVPYEPTPHETVRAMLDAAKVGPKDYVIDLGSGDGRIPIAAARDFGARALGVDVDLELLAISKRSAIASGVEKLVEFRRQDL